MTPYIEYVPKNFRADTMEVIGQANQIIASYQAEGYILTVRQIYYRFVALDLFPDDRRWRQIEETKKWVRDPAGTKNAPPNYFWLVSILNDARLSGETDWAAIEDRTRSLKSLPTWTDPNNIVRAAAQSFRTDKWARQPVRIEVWIEKESLENIFERICEELQVPFFSCRGYTSQSAMWEASQRMREFVDGGQDVHVLHFGDHDPSGIDMTRDIQDRLELFGCPLKMHRLALNMDQIKEHEPPPNPAKVTDSRFKGYLRIHGSESWELDALEPRVLAGLAREAVKGLRDDDLWNEAVKEEESARANLDLIARRWPDVVKFLRNGAR